MNQSVFNTETPDETPMLILITMLYSFAHTHTHNNSHPSFYTVIGNIRKDEALVKTMMLQDDRDKPPKKRT